MVDFTPGWKENSFIPGWNQCRKLPRCFWSAAIKTSWQSKQKCGLRTYKVLNLPSTTTRGTHGGKSVHYKMAVLAVNWYAQYDRWPLVIRREAQENVISARDRKESMFTWIFDPGMKSSRDEQISPRDHVNTQSQMTRHRGETHPVMKLVPGWVLSNVMDYCRLFVARNWKACFSLIFEKTTFAQLNEE